VEVEDRVLVLKRVHVTYRLAVDGDVDPDVLERVHRVHVRACPVYRSLHPQVEMTTSLELEP
jgi:uncharacterized OsmC-like protein